MGIIFHVGLTPESGHYTSMIYYELMGIIFHIGLTPESGHYTSMIRCEKQDSQTVWFLTNDHTISTSSSEKMSKI
jgi:uncharacterized UBP type Zn finger protein